MSRRSRSRAWSSAAVVLAFGPLVLGCGGAPSPKEALKAETVGLPAWALGKCQDALKNKSAICGSGSVQGMSNISLARSAAEGRARTELAKTLQVRVKSMLKDYQAATQGGPQNDTASEQHIEDVSKQITDMTLSGSRIEDTFISDTGTFWALVVLDPDEFKDSLKNMKDLDEAIRADIIRRADRAFRDLDRQTSP
jgi:hypothetical protein